MTNPQGIAEELARVIDPKAWATIVPGFGFEAMESEREAQRPAQKLALAKAQAILDRLPLLSRGEAVAWRWRRIDLHGPGLHGQWRGPVDADPELEPSLFEVQALGVLAAPSPELAGEEGRRFYTDDEARRQIVNLEAAALDLQARANEEIAQLRAALSLAANRLDWPALDEESGTRRRYEVQEWADEARAALQPREG